MFDDPKKELQRLEKELISAEPEKNSFDDIYSEILEEFGEKPPREEVDYLKDIIEDIPTLAQEGPNAHTAPSARHNAPRYRISNRALLVIICLECLGIAGIIGWWVLQLT